jgi:hypothetical protein
MGSLRTIRRIPIRQPVRQSPASSATQAPSRISQPGSTEGVQADAWIFSTAWWTVSVMVMPTALDGHRPRGVSQLRNSRVPQPESVRIKVRHPRR